MPTNLPPEYFEVDKRYRAAKTPAEKIETLEELLSTIPKHKGTDKLRGDLRRKLAKLKASAQTRKKTGKRDTGFRIDREGAGQVLVIGSANTGKSSLVAALTNATPEVSESPFSTWAATPGMMPIENVQVQLIDTPPLNRDFIEPELMDLIRRCDLILIVLDLHTQPIQQLEDTLTQMREHRILPLRLKAEHEGERRLTFVPILVLVNKCDDDSCDSDFEALCELLENRWPMLPVSSKTGRNLDRLKQEVFDRLELVRVYSKIPGKEPDIQSPFVMKRGGTVEEFASKVHQDFVKNLKTARVWGSSAFDGQMVPRDYVLHDEDVVELRT
ncbi:MAG TPA: TGS domain-containing protein [Anaerolineae bacterium]|nr:TGS domain-containing protein [Anaerolineae bacterium]